MTEPFSNAYKRYVLGGLTVVFTLNLVDRALMTLLLQPIKEDLRLSDTQLGFLTGIAFALFYATLGLPVARLADSRDRVTLTSLAIGLWGATVMLCLFVTNFVQLAAARVAAAIGESGCMPPTYSLVGDYFPGASERSRAMGIYWLANPLAGVVSFVLGGWLNQRYGWRMTFFLMGIPGLLVAVLFKMTVVEPRARRVADSREQRRAPGIGEVLALLWRRRTTRHLSAAVILFFTMSLGMAPWYAAFMMRVHDMGTAELGLWLGAIFGIGGMAGTLSGGFVVAKYFAGNEKGQMRLGAVMVALLVPCYVCFLLLPGKTAALVALAPLIIVLTFFIGPTFALLQRVVPEHMRATTLAVVMLLGNLIGMGLGPQVVGILSDLLAAGFGKDSLRYAMLAMSGVALWSACHYWQVGNWIEQEGI